MDASVDLSLLEVMDQTTVRAVEELTRMELDTEAASVFTL